MRFVLVLAFSAFLVGPIQEVGASARLADSGPQPADPRSQPASLSPQSTEASIPEAARRFDEGTVLIEAGRYTQAIAAFETAFAAGYENPALHYNLGVAHYRLDQLGEAVASFERARRLAPDDRMVLHNLSIVQARTRDQFSQLPDTFGQSVWRVLDRTMGAALLFGLGLLGYLIWCGLMTVRTLRASDSEWMRRGLWASALVGALALGLGLGVSMNPSDVPAAVVGVDETPLFGAPGAGEDPELEIHEGLLVAVTGSTADWTSVKLPNGVTGWVRTADLIRI